MKKLLMLLAACLLLTLPASSAFAARLDLSYVESNGDVFVIDHSSDGSAIFIETVLTAEERHFTHRYESDYFWSYTQFDILGLNMDGEDQYPVWRCWIAYANDTAFRHIDSATFVFGGVSYTFTDIDDPEEWYSIRQNEDGSTSYIEEMLIKFGIENVAFPAKLEAYRCSLPDDLSGFDCKLILHAANEDITVTLNPEFMWDFKLTLDAFIELDGLDTIQRTQSTTMHISD